MINITSYNTEIPFEIPNKDSVAESLPAGTNYTAEAWGTTESPKTVRPGTEAIVEAYRDASVQRTHSPESREPFPINLENGMAHGIQLDEELRRLISDTGEPLYVIAQASGQSNLASMALDSMEAGGLDVGVYAGEDPHSEDEHRRVGTYNAETGEIQLDDSIGNVAAGLEPK